MILTLLWCFALSATEAAERVIRIPKYYPGQAKLAQLVRTHRVTVAVWGRRAGKTFGANVILGDEALERGGSDWHAMWVAPSHDLAAVGWEEFGRWWAPAVRHESRSERMRVLLNGATIRWRSADEPTSLRARGNDFIVCDEAAWISAEAYRNSLVPSQADRPDPKRLLISTPAGPQGWFYEEYAKAAAQAPGYAKLQLPTTANPSDEVQAYVAELREFYRHAPQIFEQEIEAQFTEDAGALFVGIPHCIGGSLAEALPEQLYVLGVDVAKNRAWTVAEVLCASRRPFQVVHEDRFHDADPGKQADWLAALAHRYHRAPILFDETGLGWGFGSLLHARGAQAQGFEFTTKSRTQLLDGLRDAIGDRTIRFPAELEGLRTELQGFSFQLDESGRTRYFSRAPFSDRVMALALALQAAPRFGGPALKVQTAAQSNRDRDEEDDEPGPLDEKF